MAPSPEQVWTLLHGTLDRSIYLPTLAKARVARPQKSAPRLAHHTKTEAIVVVAAVTGIIVVAVSGTAIPWIVDPGAAAFFLPAPSVSIALQR